jgi:phosphatidylglycerophosphate synthase
MSRHWPAIAELRPVCQPPEITSRASSEHWVATLIGRRVSIYITRVCVGLGLSAHAVTCVMILLGWAAAAALLIPGLWGPTLALVLAFAQIILDSVDGEVARWRGTAGPVGGFLDRVAHATTEAAFPIALGLAVSMHGESESWEAATLGAWVAALVLLNKSLNDFVRIAAGAHALDRDRGRPEIAAPRPSILRAAHRVARFVPFHRMYHSVEQSLVIFVCAVVGALAGFNGIALALLVLAIPLPFVLLGHALAILTSRRLEPNA